MRPRYETVYSRSCASEAHTNHASTGRKKFAPHANKPPRAPICSDQHEGKVPKGIEMDSTSEIADAAGAERRGFLKCMLWAGTGVVWTVSGGVPRSALLGGSAMAATPESGELTFVQISDSHIGFSNAPNTDVAGTLNEAMQRVTQLKGNSS